MRSLYDILLLQAWCMRIRRVVYPDIKEMAKRIQKSVLFETCFSLFNNQKAAPRLPSESCLGQLFISFLQLLESRSCKKGLSLCVLSCGVVLGFSQVGVNRTKQAVDLVKTGLQVGDTISPINIERVYNHSSNNLMLPSRNADLTIIDFWATWCAPCIAALPKMDSLKSSFSGRVDFLSVTYQDEATVSPVWKSLEKRIGRSLRIPFATEDTLLRELFPHKTLPHYVWIDRKGVVRAITGPEEIHETAIRGILEGSISIPQKEEYHRPYDIKKPLFLNGNGGNGDSLLFRSILTGYVSGLQGRQAYDPSFEDRGTKLTLINATLHTLYSTAFGGRRLWIGRNRVKLDVKEPDRFTSLLKGSSFNQWMQEGNGFCYETVLPGIDNQEVYEVMKSDLDRFFPHYRADLRVIPTKCLALVKTDTYRDISSDGGKSIIKIGGDECFIQNASIDHLIVRLDVVYLQGNPYPIVNATDLSEPIDISFSAPLGDVDQINEALAKYGLRFEEGVHETEILFIEDK